MRAEYVKWIDSSSVGGWRKTKEAVTEIGQDPELICESVGFIVAEDDRAIMIAQSVGHDGESVDMTMQIPKVAILKRTVIRR